MEHGLRAAARAIYDACYPSEEWALLDFDQAERLETVQYRQALRAAHEARAVLGAFMAKAEPAAQFAHASAERARA